MCTSLRMVLQGDLINTRHPDRRVQHDVETDPDQRAGGCWQNNDGLSAE